MSPNRFIKSGCSLTNEKPLVTLIVIAYNQEKFIKEAIESALSQDYSPLEIIISDDCSKDETYSIIEECAKKYRGKHTVKINKMKSNVGLANHLNFLYEMANGIFLVHAAGDDICFPNKVSALVKPMLECDDIYGVHSSIHEIDLSGDRLDVLTKTEEYNSKLNDISYIVDNYSSVVSQSHAFRKDVHKYFGPMNSNVTNEGKVLNFREAYLGKIHYINQPLTYYRVRSGISTQFDGTVDQLTIDEPTKIAGWKYTAIQQIYDDVSKLDNIGAEIKQKIVKNLNVSKSIYNLNRNVKVLVSLRNLLPNFKIFFYGLLILIRRNAPFIIRKAYLKIFFKNRQILN